MAKVKTATAAAARRASAHQKIYCSLDIETSDFDPSVGDVLEVGMVFFEIEKDKINVVREWQSTFKTAREVSPRILALTGIGTDELERSPLFSEKSAEIQELIGDAVIVGHNINFDMRFLEGFGIKFAGKSIDTLDLAQMFLPTAPSYNLEALMGLLKVDHKDAHRALADAKATMVVLERLLQHYASFPAELKERLIKLFPLASKTELVSLLRTEFTPIAVPDTYAKTRVREAAEITKALGGKSEILCFPLGFDYYSYVYGALAKSKEKLILAVPSKKVSYQLWREGLIQPFFENSEVFDAESFERNIAGRLNAEKRLFYGKILVWKYTNWQSQFLVDLNFSFFGNQYRYLISYDNKQPTVCAIDPEAKAIAFDYYAFIHYEVAREYGKRKLLVFDINNFESALTLISSERVSWNDFIFALKQLPPSAETEKALAQVDLFFGLASMNWKKIDAAASNIAVTPEVERREEFHTIHEAAKSFVEKILAANKKFASDRLVEYCESLRDFFLEQPNHVKWVELHEGKLSFFISPINLTELSQQTLGPFKNILFTASLGSESLIKYFTGRLSLEKFEVSVIGQQELRKKIEVLIGREAYGAEKLLNLAQSLDFPAAMLLPNSASLKEFYETNFKLLQSKYKVFAQGYSGGTNKLINNFAINENSLLLATDRLISKQAGREARVKNLVVTRLPFEQFNHPLFAMQAAKYENQFTDFNIPRALYNFHSVIRFFYSEDLEKIYILDPKINKEYGKYFIDYLKSLPFVEIVYI